MYLGLHWQNETMLRLTHFQMRSFWAERTMLIRCFGDFCKLRKLYHLFCHERGRLGGTIYMATIDPIFSALVGAKNIPVINPILSRISRAIDPPLIDPELTVVLGSVNEFIVDPVACVHFRPPKKFGERARRHLLIPAALPKDCRSV